MGSHDKASSISNIAKWTELGLFHLSFSGCTGEKCHIYTYEMI